MSTKMPDRYFVQTPITGEQVSLTGPEAHHLINVMRARQGAKVILFDGSGCEFLARVEQLGRSDVELTVLGREEVDRELPFVLTLGVALPKGDRQKWLVEKAVELGAGRVIPLKTQRAVAQPVQQALDRLRRSVVEASKQCGRNRLMEIAEPLEFSDYVDAARHQPCRLLAHPHTSHAKKNMPHAGELEGVQHTDPMVHFMHPTDDAELPSEIFLAVGPEGGFTNEEVDMAAKDGWHIVDLGPRILRIETAAVLLVAIVAHQMTRRVE
ncbi:MAG: 16S rRNA (uracil(1498)-N(3))-methyltransferase [Thermoguttaceae bacterium]